MYLDVWRNLDADRMRRGRRSVDRVDFCGGTGADEERQEEINHGGKTRGSDSKHCTWKPGTV